jgi:hypothetical protein
MDVFLNRLHSLPAAYGMNARTLLIVRTESIFLLEKRCPTQKKKKKCAILWEKYENSIGGACTPFSGTVRNRNSSFLWKHFGNCISLNCYGNVVCNCMSSIPQSTFLFNSPQLFMEILFCNCISTLLQVMHIAEVQTKMVSLAFIRNKIISLRYE